MMKGERNRGHSLASAHERRAAADRRRVPLRPLSRADAIRRIVARQNLDEFIEQVVDSFWDRPEMQETRPEREEMREFVRLNVQLAMGWLVEGKPPTEADFEIFRERARQRAAEGSPADLTPSNFRRAARYAWGAMLDAAVEEERLALLESAGLLFEYVDRMLRIFSEAYEEAIKQSPVSAEETAARALLQRVETDELPVAEDYMLAERIGFHLESGAWSFVIACPGRPAHHHAELAALLRRRHALAVFEGRRVVGLSNTERAWEGLLLDVGAIIGTGPRVIRNECGRLLDDLRAAADVAAACGVSGEIEVDDYLAEVLLRRSPRIAAKLSARVYGSLGDELAHTLDVLVEHSFERGRAAAALPVHRNTLRDRITRIEETAGLDLDSAEGRGLAWLAWLQRRDTARGAGY